MLVIIIQPCSRGPNQEDNTRNRTTIYTIIKKKADCERLSTYMVQKNQKLQLKDFRKLGI